MKSSGNKPVESPQEITSEILNIDTIYGSVTSADRLYEYAEHCYRNDMMPEAELLYARSLALESVSQNRQDAITRAVIGLGIAQMRQDKLDDAESSFRLALEVGAPGTSSNYMNTCNNLILLAAVRNRCQQVKQTH